MTCSAISSTSCCQRVVRVSALTALSTDPSDSSLRLFWNASSIFRSASSVTWRNDILNCWQGCREKEMLNGSSPEGKAGVGGERLSGGTLCDQTIDRRLNNG